MTHYDQLFKASGGSYKFNAGISGVGGGASHAASGEAGQPYSYAASGNIAEEGEGGADSAPTSPVTQFQAEEKSKRTSSGRKLVSSLKGFLKKDKKKKPPSSASSLPAVSSAAPPSNGLGGDDTASSTPALPSPLPATEAPPVGATLRAVPPQPKSYREKGGGFSRKKMLTGFREKKTAGVKDMAKGMAEIASTAALPVAAGPNQFTAEAEALMHARMARESQPGLHLYDQHEKAEANLDAASLHTSPFSSQSRTFSSGGRSNEGSDFNSSGSGSDTATAVGAADVGTIAIGRSPSIEVEEEEEEEEEEVHGDEGVGDKGVGVDGAGRGDTTLSSKPTPVPINKGFVAKSNPFGRKMQLTGMKVRRRCTL